MVKREAKNKKKEGTKSKKHVGHVRERKPIPKKKKAKDAFPDFTKKPKRKVGKKKLKPAKSTNPVVRSKGIVIRGLQAPNPDDGQYRTERGQTLEDLLPRLTHYSPGVRRDAFQALAAAAKARHASGAPVVATSLVGTLLTRCLACVLDEDEGVRQSLVGALAALFTTSLPKERALPFLGVVFRYANLALTHVLAGIQRTGIQLLTQFFAAYRAELHGADLAFREGAQVLCSLVRFSRAEYTLAGRRTTGTLQVMDLLIALLQIRLTGPQEAKDAAGAGKQPVEYDDFWSSVTLQDPLLQGHSGDTLEGLGAAKKGKRQSRYKAPREAPAAQPAASPAEVSSTPVYFSLLSLEDRLHFFDDVTAILKSRWVEVNPSGKRDRQEGGLAPGALHEAGYLALAVNTAVAVVGGCSDIAAIDCPTVAKRLGWGRRDFLLQGFVMALPLPEALARGEGPARLHATLQLALLGSTFVPRYRTRAPERWILTIQHELLAILEDPDVELLEGVCTPCLSAPLPGVPCITLLIHVVERLIHHLPTFLSAPLSAALLRLFRDSGPGSAIKQEGVRFLRRYVDHYTRGRPTPLSPWFLDWAVTLPRLLWEVRQAEAEALQADVLHVLRAVLCLEARPPAPDEGQTGAGTDGNGAEAEVVHATEAEVSQPGKKKGQPPVPVWQALRQRQREVQAALVKAVWSASRSDPPTVVYGCFVHFPEALQRQCVELLFYFDCAAEAPPRGHALLPAIQAALRREPVPTPVLLQLVEALQVHCGVLDPALHARFLLDLLPEGEVPSPLVRAVAAALRSVGAAARDPKAVAAVARPHPAAALPPIAALLRTWP
eukprot:EG_transcript_2661